MDTIEINGESYVKASSVPQPASGERAVVVIDRGWIYAGDVEERAGRVILTRAVWVFKWERVGFDQVIANPTQDAVKIRPMSQPINIPAGAELYRVPVPDGWGL